MSLKRLNRIYYQNELKINIIIEIYDNNFHYLINVLRLKTNNYVKVFNGVNGEFLGKIITIHKKKLEIFLEKELRNIELIQKTNITLAISVIKEYNLLVAVDMATQIGVDKILPIITEYTQHKYNNADRVYRRIIESTEQSNRLAPPILLDPIKLNSIINSDYTILYANEHESVENSLNNLKIDINQNLILLIGPEGGFSLNELNILKTKTNIFSFSLGKYILRSETATITGLSQLIYLKDLCKNLH